jgi:hypothetical protein
MVAHFSEVMVWSLAYVIVPRPRRLSIITLNSDTPRSLLRMDFRAEPMLVFVPGVDPKRARKR